MYGLSIGLTYENFLRLDKKYRYDLLAISPKSGYGLGPLNSSVFIFRTVKTSYLVHDESVGNILIDVVNYRNINGFDTAIHGDCHFHILELEDFNLKENIFLTKDISLNIIRNDFSKSVYAITKNQKVIKMQDFINNNCNKVIKLDEIKHLLFTINDSSVVNCKNVELAKVFSLQAKHIWHNNRHYNFNSISKIDINKNLNTEINSSTSWDDAKKIIENNYNDWGLKSDYIFHNLMHVRWSFDYEILD